MNELIAIEKRDGKETVNARDLHGFLEVQTQYKDWIRTRIEKYGFTENIDFVAVAEKKATAQGNLSEFKIHFLSLDMAKELSMVENNEKGREARRYFIEVENRARENFNGPRLLAVAVLEAQKMLDQKDQLIQEMKPKADFFDTVAGSKEAIRMADVAKTLDFPGMGRNCLFDFLRNGGVLQSNNVPYQSQVDAGRFRVVLQEYTTPDGETHIKTSTLVYPKGMEFIRKHLLASGYTPRKVAS